MRIVVVSSPVAIADEAVIINKLFASGLTHFQLRKPAYSLAELRKLLEEIEDQYYQGISLHQFHEIALEFGIERLHFTEKMRREAAVGDLKVLNYEGYKLSTSIHSLADFDDLIGFESAFFSPVFNSLSKPGYHGVVAKDFRHTKTHKKHLIALGGVTAENIKNCIAMNFDGVAVLGAIWNDPLNAVKGFRNIKEVINNESNR